MLLIVITIDGSPYHKIHDDNKSQNVQNSKEYPAFPSPYSSPMEVTLPHIDTTSCKVALMFIHSFLFFHKLLSHWCARLGILSPLKLERACLLRIF